MSDVVFLAGDTPSGERVVLRSLEMDDLERVLRWANDPELRLTTNRTLPMSHAAEQEWVERMTKPARPNPTDLVFAIVVGGTHIGLVGIHEINFVHRHAVTGLIIGEREYRGRKIGPTVKRLITRYAFEELNLETLRASVYAGNDPSVRMQEVCGYALVARIPHWLWKNGEWRDELIYILHRDAWRTAQRAS